MACGVVCSAPTCFLQTQIREAQDNMKRKAKELQQQRREAMKYGRKPGYGGGGFGSDSMGGGRGGGMDGSQIIDTPAMSMDSSSSSHKPTPSRAATYVCLFM